MAIESVAVFDPIAITIIHILYILCETEMNGNEEHATVLQADEGPAKKKKLRTHSNNPPLFSMLTPDIFSEQVLAFFQRKDVVEIMEISFLRSNFRLNESFCPTHGTRFNKENETTQLECIDCVMQERHCFRCDQCDTFHQEDALFEGKCGKVFCESCNYSTVCVHCEQRFHVDCSTCGIFDTCDSCCKGYCGVSEQLQICGGCNNGQFCQVCISMHGMDRCWTCDEVYCEQCSGHVSRCQRCENFYCQDCGGFETKPCDGCDDDDDDNNNENDRWTCRKCSILWIDCNTCNKSFCERCSVDMIECQRCDKSHCQDCVGSETCGRCEGPMCKPCWSRSLTGLCSGCDK